MNLKTNVPLKDFSNFRIGGPAEYFFQAHTMEELGEAMRLSERLNFFILGGGTNVLIDDKGFDGLVIYNKIGGIKLDGTDLTVGSGVLVSDVLDFCIRNSLSGLEWAGGLPGTIGGAVRGNAGAFKGEIKDSVTQVQSLNLSPRGEAGKTQNQMLRNNSECNFAYRSSVFKSEEGKGEFITSVMLRLRLGVKVEIQRKIAEKIDYRNAKHPMNYPNIGSTFKNIPLDSLSEKLQKEFEPFIKTDPFPVVPTTKLLALAGLKGRRIGGAMISDKHPNFIVNVDNAKAQDVQALIKIAKDAIYQKYGISLEEEIIYL